MAQISIKKALAKILQNVAELTTAKNNLKSTVLSYVYPVGSIYISTSSTSPATFIGGTWQRITGRFLLATGAPDANTDNYFGSMSGVSWNAGPKSKGGQDYHTLTEAEMPKHRHYAGKNSSSEAAGYGLTATAAFQNRVLVSGEGNWGSYTGSGGKHNNMPPYYAVYVWERTA